MHVETTRGARKEEFPDASMLLVLLPDGRWR
ncbi:unnamed protein product, partial [Litomosoides sigmodontis]